MRRLWFLTRACLMVVLLLGGWMVATYWYLQAASCLGAAIGVPANPGYSAPDLGPGGTPTASTIARAASTVYLHGLCQNRETGALVIGAHIRVQYLDASGLREIASGTSNSGYWGWDLPLMAGEYRVYSVPPGGYQCAGANATGGVVVLGNDACMIRFSIPASAGALSDIALSYLPVAATATPTGTATATATPRVTATRRPTVNPDIKLSATLKLTDEEIWFITEAMWSEVKWARLGQVGLEDKEEIEASPFWLVMNDWPDVGFPQTRRVFITPGPGSPTYICLAFQALIVVVRDDDPWGGFAVLWPVGRRA